LTVTEQGSSAQLGPPLWGAPLGGAMSRRRVWEEDLPAQGRPQGHPGGQGQDDSSQRPWERGFADGGTRSWEGDHPDMAPTGSMPDTGSVGPPQRPGDADLRGERATGRAWEEHGPDQGADPANEDRGEAGLQLARCLVQLHAEGKLTAKSTCILAHWAHKAGAAGPVGALAFRPQAPTGHYQRHLDRAAGFRDQDYYKLSVPTYAKRTKDSQQRVPLQISVLPPHECVNSEFCEDPGLQRKAQVAAWPAAFGEHPVAKRAGGPVVPLALYLDGAQYSKVGASVLVFVVVNMLTGTKHLISTLNKRLLCRCGCRGWCTLRPIMQFLAWSFGALACGAYPTTQHEGEPWPEDSLRASLGGSPLACGTCAVQQVRGDWAEFAHSLGFPT
jgi:hypothetical protein